MPVDHFGRKFSGAEPAASTRWVFLLLLSGPAICWLSLSGRWFRGATHPVGRESSGPPPFAPSLNVQGDATHNNSGFSVI